MKKVKKSSPAKLSVPLRFELPGAKEVFVTGTFDNWNGNRVPLSRDGGAVWCTTLKLAPGRYEYRLVVDGCWIDVPGAPETVENVFGSRNAILQVGAGA